MAKTSASTLKAIQKYKQKLDEVRFSVPAGGKSDIMRVASEKGYPSMQAYLKALIEQDSGLELGVKREE